MAVNQENLNYHDKVNIDNTLRLREITATLPSFCREFFLGIKDTTSTRTRLAYAYDLRIFFEYLHENNPVLKNKEITDFEIGILEMIKPIDIIEYLDYLTYYEKENEAITNDERGKQRKLASLRSMYNFFFRNEMIEKNPAALVQMPKLHEKEIIRLDADEVAMLLDHIEQGENMTKQQAAFHKKTKVRDLALITLLLGTGIRVSECVGLDIKDVDFKNNGILIRRKGGYEAVVYFGDEVCNALELYLEERGKIIPESGHEDALFLSLQNKRISVRAVEKLVKKYAQAVTSLKKITPHKLRSTYGTSLYRETGDIYLVADVLGHKDVNTTKKHYAAQDDERRRQAANVVKLREGS
ncbi:MAG: tyrosine-type recombinase/integrase [Lachnospiraceae bacterium]|nr:tyrosine-type recombinase/integrase [Lachnospiraceae bacterium]